MPLDIKDKEEQQAENVRKMLLAMSEDIRVIIIKLADRLHNIRTLNFVAPQKRRDKALETLEIYAPIAHRLGIRAIKEELEDRAISYLDPIAYKEIEDALAKQGKSHNEFLETIKEQVGERVKEVVPNAHIEGRIKSVHGIYRKMYMQNKNFDEIYDIYAVRIIVDTTIECYDCLGIIHDMFNPIPGRFKDYISTPKPNMYQSLHTTVIGKAGIPFEVQIRTWDMHKTAEYGIAAHWKYKLGINGKEKFEERLAWIRQLLETQKEADDVKDIVRTIKSDLVPEEVFVFTPIGRYQAKANDLYYPYVRPQENGHHTDVRWIRLEDHLGNGLLIKADSVMEFNALRNSIEDFDQGKTTNHHADEIHPRHFVEVCLDGFMQGVGGYDSWGSRPAPQHQLPADRAYHFGFSIQPVVRS